MRSTVANTFGSRARSLDGLKVMSLGDNVGKGGNAQVKEFLWQKFKLR